MATKRYQSQNPLSGVDDEISKRAAFKLSHWEEISSIDIQYTRIPRLSKDDGELGYTGRFFIAKASGKNQYGDLKRRLFGHAKFEKQ